MPRHNINHVSSARHSRQEVRTARERKRAARYRQLKAAGRLEQTIQVRYGQRYTRAKDQTRQDLLEAFAAGTGPRIFVHPEVVRRADRATANAVAGWWHYETLDKGVPWYLWRYCRCAFCAPMSDPKLRARRRREDRIVSRQELMDYQSEGGVD